MYEVWIVFNRCFGIVREEFILIQKGSGVRGKIINETIVLEKFIDNFLSIYFGGTKPKQKELFELVFCNDRFNFSAKYEVFNYLIKSHYPSFSKENPTFSTDIKKIIEDRNIMAHYLLDTRDEAVNDIDLGFYRLRNHSERTPYSESRIIEILQLLHKYQIALQKLFSQA